MSTRKIGSLIIGTATLAVVFFTIYKLAVGKEVGFNEIMSISALLMMLFSTMTWGTKEESDGILQEEELGQRITEKSSKISYFVLLGLILIAVTADHFVNGTANIFLLLIFGCSLFTLPLVEFLVAKKYQ